MRDGACCARAWATSVEEAEPPVDFAPRGQPAGVVIAASVAPMLDTRGEQRGRPIAEDEVETVTWSGLPAGPRPSATRYIQALLRAHAFGRAMPAFFERYDTPALSTLGRPPVPVGELRGGRSTPDYAERLFAFMPNTQAFNVTGQPAMRVPLA